MEAWLRMHEEFAKKIPGIQHIVTDAARTWFQSSNQS